MALGTGASSAVSDVEMTTSTVYSTQFITVTSCAETVTNCPAESTKVVTSVIAISTTICPVTEAGGSPPTASATATAPIGTGVSEVAASSSATAPMGTGAYSVPLGTGVSDVVSATASGPAETVTHVTNSTLTYTLGAGSSTTVVTTTIQHTSTETLYKVGTPISEHTEAKLTSI
jgi:hypothetical protein